MTGCVFKLKDFGIGYDSVLKKMMGYISGALKGRR